MCVHVSCYYYMQYFYLHSSLYYTKKAFSPHKVFLMSSASFLGFMDFEFFIPVLSTTINKD